MGHHEPDYVDFSPGSESANFIFTLVSRIFESLSQKATIEQDLSEAVNDYLARLQTYCNTVSMWEMKATSLEKVFAQTRFSIRATVDRGELDKVGPVANEQTNARTYSGEEILKRGRHLILLGGAGSGKTTFLKATLSSLVHGVSIAAKLPMFVSARELGNSEISLFEYLVSELDGLPIASQFLHQSLKEGEIALFLDGLDEISTGERLREVAGELNRFVEKYPLCRVVTTCRSAVYEGWFDRFEEAEIAPFDEDRIIEFVEGWFSDKPEEARGCLNDLALRSDAFDFASSPLLLCMVCEYYSKFGEISPNKAQLHIGALTGILGRWDRTRLIERPLQHKKMPLVSKEALLAHIAREGLQKERDNSWKQEEMENIIEDYSRKFISELDGPCNGASILEMLEQRHGILCHVSRGKVAFSHQAFYDYFAAKHVVDESGERGLLWLVEEVDNSKFSEIIPLVTSMQGNSDFLIEPLWRQVANLSEIQHTLSVMLKRFSEKAIGGAMITRCYSVLCSLFQVRHLALAFDSANSKARQMPTSETVQFLDGVADHVITRVANWCHVDMTPSGVAEHTMLGTEDLSRAEAFSNLFIAKTNYRKNTSAFIRSIKRDRTSITLMEVDLDSPREMITEIHHLAYDFGHAVRKILRRYLVLIDSVNAGAIINSSLRHDILASRVFGDLSIESEDSAESEGFNS